MSMDSIKRFNEDVKNSNNMQEDIKTIGNDVDKIVSYANEKGYSFSAADIKAAGNKDLSDEELDSVAGGGVVVVAFGIIKALVI